MSKQGKTTRPEHSSSGQRARDQLLASVPLAERRIEMAGVSTAVLAGGDGPPVVLLHGQGEFAAVWIRVVSDLVERHRVIVPDLPGHGASAVTEGRLGADTVLTWLDELIDQTCQYRPVLVGHLLGGAIAARYAVANSERITHLVLVDTMGLGWFRPAPSFALPMMGFAVRPTPRSRDRMFSRCFLDFDRVVAELNAEHWQWLGDYALDRARTPSVQTAVRQLASKLGMPPVRPKDLERISVPTTLIHGRHDLQVQLRTAETASRRYGWPLHVIEDCRDDPAFEQPEAFLAALRTALGTSTEEEETT